VGVEDVRTVFVPVAASVGELAWRLDREGGVPRDYYDALERLSGRPRAKSEDVVTCACPCGYKLHPWDPDRESDQPSEGRLLTRGAWVELFDMIGYALHYRSFRDEEPTDDPEELFRRIERWAEEVAKKVLQCPQCGSLVVEETPGGLLCPGRRDGVHAFRAESDALAKGLLRRIDDRRAEPSSEAEPGHEQ
jgi:hypothetical protein